MTLSKNNSHETNNRNDCLSEVIIPIILTVSIHVPTVEAAII